MRIAPLALAFLPTAAPAEWVLGAYLGHGATRPTHLEILRPDLELRIRDVQFRGEPFRSPVYYGYRVSKFVKPSFGIEGEFIHLKVLGETEREVQFSGSVQGRATMRSVVQRFDISHGVNLVLFNGVWRRKLADWVSVAFRGGAGFTVPHPESQILGQSFEQYQFGNLAAQGAGGLEFRIWRGLHVPLEYKFTWTRPEVDVANGVARTELQTHHVIFGLAVHLGR